MTAELAIYETDEALILAGKTPSINGLNLQVQPNSVIVTGTEQDKQFLQQIKLPKEVNPELSMIVIEDDEVRAVLPKVQSDE